MSQILHVEEQRSITIVTLDNPPANTLTEQTLNDLEALIHELNANKKNRALIITGAGEKFFSAGAELTAFDHDSTQRCQSFSDAFKTAFSALTHYQGVSIAAINGYAMGGGLELALCCDIRIAEEHGLMALPECRVGLLPCGLGTQHLTQLIGEQWAKRMILLGEKLSAEQALNLGLISEIVEPSLALQHAITLCDQINAQSPEAVLMCKHLIMGSRDTTMSNMIKKENAAFQNLFTSSNRREGVRAFIEKRTPEWELDT